MTGGVLMRKSKQLRQLFIAIALWGIFLCFTANGMAQDRIPSRAPSITKLKAIKPLREMNRDNDTILVQTSFPSAFRGTRQ